MANERVNDLLNRVPITLLATLYLGYLGFQYYEFTNDGSSPLAVKKAELVQAKSLNDQLRKKLKQADLFYKTLESKKREIRSLALELNEMKTSLSEELDIAAFIKMVVTEAKKVGMEVKAIKPTEELKDEFYIQQNFQMDFEGVYIQFLTFLERISNAQAIIRMGDFDIQPKAKGQKGKYVKLQGRVQIVTYRYNGSKADEIAEKSTNEETINLNPNSPQKSSNAGKKGDS